MSVTYVYFNVFKIYLNLKCTQIIQIVFSFKSKNVRYSYSYNKYCCLYNKNTMSVRGSSFLHDFCSCVFICVHVSLWVCLLNFTLNAETECCAETNGFGN